jgi:hypothetical protein
MLSMIAMKEGPRNDPEVESSPKRHGGQKSGRRRSRPAHWGIYEILILTGQGYAADYGENVCGHGM